MLHQGSPQRQENRLQLTPRSAGFVPDSIGARPLISIRSFLSEAEPSSCRKNQRNLVNKSKSLRRLALRSNKSQKSPNMAEKPVESWRASDGKHRRIVTQHQLESSSHPSLYQVNNVPDKQRDASSRVTSHMSGMHGSQVGGERAASALVRSQHSASHSDPNRLNGGMNTLNPSSSGKGDETPRRFIEAPSIPLSPMKVSLDNFRVSTDDGQQSLGAHSNVRKSASSQVSSPPLEKQPRTPNLAGSDSNRFQQIHFNAHKSQPMLQSEASPVKVREDVNTVAGMSHKYPVFPNYTQRVKELQAVQARAAKTEPAAQPDPPKSYHSSTHSSSWRKPQESSANVKPTITCINNDPTQPAPIIPSDEPSEDAYSDSSSGVVSNAQSAIRMHVRTTGGPFGDSVNCCDLPPLGPAPTRALPSLPEHHDSPEESPVSGATGDLRNPNSTGVSKKDVSIPQKSPRRQEYKVFPSDSSPKQRKGPAPPATMSGAEDPGIATSPFEAPSRIPRKSVAFPQPGLNLENMSAHALNELQKQREDRAAARKERDMARMKAQRKTYEEGATSGSTIANGVEHHEGVTILPQISHSCTSSLSTLDLQKQKFSQKNETSVCRSHHDKDQTAGRPSAAISPIVVVADQEPISPDISRNPSQRSQRTVFKGSPEDRPGNLYATKAHLSHPSSPSLQLPQLDEHMRARPSSTHSVPPSTRPVGSRTPTPFAHHLLQRKQSNRSSYRTSSIAESAHVRDLEARLSAIEKKNVMLETAFLAVMRVSSSFEQRISDDRDRDDQYEADESIHSEPETRDVYDEEDVLDIQSQTNGITRRNGDGSSGTESLYAGLENLLAVHASDAGKRLSSSSFV